MIVVDAQVHIWKNGAPPPNHRQTPISAGELLSEMTAARVDRAVLVPPLWDPAGNQFSLDAAALYPQRLAVMGLVNLDEPMPPGVFKAWLKRQGMLGVRVSFNSPQKRLPLVDGRADWVWASAEAIDAPVMVLAPYLCAVIGMIARRHPTLRLVVDHMAVPRGAKGATAFQHLPELVALARYPNVAVKMTGVPNYAENESYPYRSLHEPLKRVLDAFGSERCFWGSDLSRLHGSYAECADMFRNELHWLGSADRSAIMGEGLCAWLKWEGRHDEAVRLS